MTTPTEEFTLVRQRLTAYEQEIRPRIVALQAVLGTEQWVDTRLRDLLQEGLAEHDRALGSLTEFLTPDRARPGDEFDHTLIDFFAAFQWLVSDEITQPLTRTMMAAMADEQTRERRTTQALALLTALKKLLSTTEEHVLALLLEVRALSPLVSDTIDPAPLRAMIGSLTDSVPAWNGYYHAIQAPPPPPAAQQPQGPQVRGETGVPAGTGPGGARRRSADATTDGSATGAAARRGGGSAPARRAGGPAGGGAAAGGRDGAATGAAGAPDRARSAARGTAGRTSAARRTARPRTSLQQQIEAELTRHGRSPYVSEEERRRQDRKRRQHLRQQAVATGQQARAASRAAFKAAVASYLSARRHADQEGASANRDGDTRWALFSFGNRRKVAAAQDGKAVFLALGNVAQSIIRAAKSDADEVGGENPWRLEARGSFHVRDPGGSSLSRFQLWRPVEIGVEDCPQKLHELFREEFERCVEQKVTCTFDQG